MKDLTSLCLLCEQLLVSLDGDSWRVARTHKNDKTLANKGGYGVHTWALPSDIGAARFFKILVTGGNTIGGRQLACCGFEVYGRCVFVLA